MIFVMDESKWLLAHTQKEKFHEVQNHFISVTVKVRNVPRSSKSTTVKIRNVP
jgi:hypothetical protein